MEVQNGPFFVIVFATNCVRIPVLRNGPAPILGVSDFVALLMGLFSTQSQRNGYVMPIPLTENADMIY